VPRPATKSASRRRAPAAPAAPLTVAAEARLPQAADLDVRPAEDVVKLLLDEELSAVRAARARAAAIARAAELVAARLTAGGRLVYVGAGTAGRLGTLDAAECVPTFGIPPSRVAAVMAGGPGALTRSIDGADDNARDAEGRMRRIAVGPADAVCCVGATGATPFLRSALEYARFRRAATIFVTCSPPEDGPAADILIDVVTGPEVIAGSTRLKAGTATKVVLNAISTTAFVLLGKIYAGLMVDVRPTNPKLWAQAVRIVNLLTGLEDDAARALIEKAGGRAKVAIVMHHARVNAARARELLIEHKGALRAIIGDVEPGLAATL
jgi:N-acetylmuramic acid 6-phosphate etherase